MKNPKLIAKQALQEQHIHQATLLAAQTNVETHLAERQARIDELARLNQQVQTNLEHYREAAREQRLADQHQYETRLNELEQRTHQLQEKRTSLLTENTKLKSEWEHLVLGHEQLKKDYVRAEKDQSEKTEKLHEIKQLLAEKRNAVEQLTAQQKKDQERIEEQQTQLVEREKRLAASTEKNTLQREQLKELTSQNKKLAHEKWFLDCEKTRLVAQVERVVTSAK